MYIYIYIYIITCKSQLDNAADTQAVGLRFKPHSD